MKTLCLIGVLALMAPVAIAAREPTQLSPSSDWLLDYADERCTLVRDFGEGDQSLQLRIESFGSWHTFRVTILGRGVPRSGRATKEIQFRFSQDEEDRDTRALFGMIGDQRGLTFSTAFGPPEPNRTGLSRERLRELNAIPKAIDAEFEGGVSSILVELGSGKRVDLATGGMAAPLKAMRDCVDDLQKSWGVDPAVQRELSRWPVIRIETVRDVQRQYPPTMVIAENNAFVAVRVMIGRDGEATSCVIQNGAVPKPFTDAVCEGLMGSYEPALDKAGNPVPTVYNTTVLYLLEG